jgi:hypothetical protein
MLNKLEALAWPEGLGKLITFNYLIGFKHMTFNTAAHEQAAWTAPSNAALYKISEQGDTLKITQFNGPFLCLNYVSTCKIWGFHGGD